MWEGYPYFPLRKDFPLAGKPTRSAGRGVHQAAPLEGGPFVTVAGGKDAIEREPRVRTPEGAEPGMQRQAPRSKLIIFMATVQDIEIRDSAARAAQAAEELAGRAGREDGPEHGAVASGHARRAAHRARTGRRNHHQGRPGRGLSASRRRKDRREHDLHPVHPLHGPAGLPRAAGQQRRLRAGGRKTARHRQGFAAALPVHPRHLRGTGAHFRRICSASALRDGPGRGDGVPAHVHRARENLQPCEALTGARFTTSYTRIGGVSRDLPPGWVDAVPQIPATKSSSTLDEVETLLTRNRIWVDRTRGVARDLEGGRD